VRPTLPEKKPTHEPVLRTRIPSEKLGLPGAAYQLYAQGRRKGEEPQLPRQDSQDNYGIVLTLSRTVSTSHELTFEPLVPGDSFVQLIKPKSERVPADPDELVIFFGHGSHRLEIAGKANDEGRLSKLSVQMPAQSFPDAENIAFGAISPFLSAVAFELDVPIRVAQLDVTQISSRTSSMTYTCPYPNMTLTGLDQNNTPYVQSLMSLYREGINSNSPNYQFLCWYKILEGANAKREAETLVLKAPLHLALPERLEHNKIEQRKRLVEVFPNIRAFGTDDAAWDDLVPSEVMGWKFNRVREKKLEPLRNRIAHMISEASGDLSLSPDSRKNSREVTKWISLLRFIARVVVINEKGRIPPPQASFAIPPNAKHIDELRRGVMGQQ
jgi:hypothetical protein